MNKNKQEVLGDIVDNWQAPPYPLELNLEGKTCTLERLSVDKHSKSLWAAYSEDPQGALWRYLPYGDFSIDQKGYDEFYQLLSKKQAASNKQQTAEHFYAIIDGRTQRALGFIAYARIAPTAGSIEIAHLCFSPALKQTTLSTEAVFLMINNAFTLGYRRCEWKCHSLNQPSKNAAARFGFQYEGCFRQATVTKGRNRDTDWFSIIDKEWPALKKAYALWLSDGNFDDHGKQITSLKECMR